MADWKILKSEEVFTHPVLSVTCSSRRLGEHTADYVTLHSSDWVNVVPVTSDGRVVLIKQWRHGSQDWAIEIPGGLVDQGETPAQAAARELAEETGYQARGLRFLGKVNPNPALFDNYCHTFLAEGLEGAAEPQLDPGESIEVFTVRAADLPAMVATGEIDHCIVIAALAFYWLSQGQDLAAARDLL